MTSIRPSPPAGPRRSEVASEQAESGGGGPGVVVLSDYFPPASRSGGPLRSIPAIVRSEAMSTRVCVLTRNRDFGVRRRFTAEEIEQADRTLPGVVVRRFQGLVQPLTLWRALRQELAPGCLLYVNSLLSPLYSLWPLVLMRCGALPRRRVLLTPRGELAPAALATKSTKKRIALPFIRRILSGLDLVWQASSDREAEEIRSFIGELGQSVIVRSHPPPAPQRVAAPDNAVLTVAFVGRMVPGKNFRLLADALQGVECRIRVLVVGILEDQAYWRSCQSSLGLAGPNVEVVTTGHLEHDDVIETLHHADAMVLPTRGESFGHSIAEALSLGCPVVIPDTTLWTDMVRQGGGTIIESDDPAMLVEALTALARRDAGERQAARLTAAELYARWWRADQRRSSLFRLARHVPRDPGRPLNGTGQAPDGPG
ncbi:glycosyltransferase family 4 protein [Nakamurella sp.]|uniref:glycosyltransferase family 4 protein n=1 Tax=Nakamurella sp. TaxID=1869182 RepID=UPI003B3B48EA